MWVRTIVIRNGSLFIDYEIYKCDECGCEIEEAHPRYENKIIHYCIDCAFKKKLLSESSYISLSGISIAKRAAVNPFTNKIELNTGELFFLEKENNNQRRTKEYKEWRKSIFERDNYSCQICGQVGGNLNAHHIKSFKDFPKLRLEVDNGITLCVKCHREVHSNGRSKVD